MRSTPDTLRLELRENLAQFPLLVLVNAFVGAMVGLKRSILPAIAEQEFELATRTAGALTYDRHTPTAGLPHLAVGARRRE